MGNLKTIRRKIMEVATKGLIHPFERKKPATKKVAIIIPMSTRKELTEDEQISMRQLNYYLGSYDKYLLVPEGLEFDFQGYRNKPMPRKFFGSAGAHGKLLGNRFFYHEFLDYEFVFFFHLDSLVFSDQLEEWCASGIDYIGPPWINCEDSPWVDRPRVGNGGFTLLRVESALKALTNRYLQKPTFYWFDVFTSMTPQWVIAIMEKIEKIFPRFWPVKRLLQEWREMDSPSEYNRNNDIFWSDTAVRFLPEFRVGTLDEGLRFAFEVSPRTCMEMNGGIMPFGCHAWTRYDRAFWEPYLVQADGAVVQNKLTKVEEEYFESATRTA